MSVITPTEQAEIDRANASTAQPVVFVHGLWLLPNSWNDWRTYFEDQGFVTLAPGWPDDPATTAEARRDPSVFARKSVGEITEHYAEIIRALDRKPIVIGHSFGGMITQKLAGMGLTKTAVAVDPAPFRGVLPLPVSALRAAFPVIGNPLNRGRAIALTPKQFRFAFANAVSEDEANRLYDEYSVAGSGVPLFQAALANFNPGTEAKVDTKNPDRGPLLIISGEKDHTVPPAIAKASYKQYKKNPNVTEIVEIPGRGHSLVIDGGWKEVADTALDFVRRV
ncbi:alpha/beta hydrolase [Mycobacterium sp. CBMA293]|uniref:alpha/beta hydrolase n=1 Tax=unclassified Mycolicibacterium TaxID=2636767 RepID=UPI0012DE29DD|nr:MULTISPECIES: alpha/beta hydrolase [unclassified Mycolicibacterium]MUL49364.1 alpha/beta hydrolase [Mycolicibacterium sp. CBMA 360]MUL57731.1 alpha/beta hydrolase [Mycolicibacterium sp. CBMA 335]MUL72820.1 alpha/beta hydrolase [Mycolicibacterium sp. CBMA 311]MUL96770.1 alpha/beta hydrolase [Mycolicibacterium sp. CBMA 230]MUM07163.1 alpha/beta hydrolase [Mycolicibacterium sp. CBMA 213]